MKDFWIYTALRVGLFLACLVTVFGIWALVADTVSILWIVVIAFVVSGIASLFLLNRPREAFAQRVEARAHRMSTAFEERKAREDVD